MKRLLLLLFPAQFRLFRKNWQQVISDKFFLLELFLNLFILLIIAFLIPIFFEYVQNTPGYQISDPILIFFPVRNLSIYIFCLIYSIILLAIVNIMIQPLLLLRLLKTYWVLTLLRLLCMYLIPLEPDRDIIPLEDPFVGRLFYNSSVITKDLFFSGHVSTMSLLSFLIPFSSLKYLFAIATVFVAAFILMQHVHYTIDILFAPVISWLCYTLIK